MIFNCGDKNNSLYILIEGEVKTFLPIQEEECVLETISEPGSVFGECTFID